MDKLSLPSILFVSIPGLLLLTITVILMVGHKDFLKLNKANIIKIALAAALNTVFAVLLRAICPVFLLSIALDIVFFSMVYILIFKIRWHEIVVATLLAVLEFFVIGSVLTSSLVVVSGLSPENILKSDFFCTVFSLPVRLLELTIIIILSKIPLIIIDLRPLRRVTSFIKEFSLLSLCLFFGVMLITNTIKLTVFDLKLDKASGAISYLFTYLILVILLMSAIFATISRIKRSSDKEKLEYLHTLLCVKSLVHDDEQDIIKAERILNSEIDRMKSRYGD